MRRTNRPTRRRRGGTRADSDRVWTAARRPARAVTDGSARSFPGAAAQYTTNPPRELPKRRGTELALLAFSALIVTLAFVLVQANQEQELSWSVVWYGLAYLAIFGVAHLAVRRAVLEDPLILPCVALLNGLGLVMIHRIDLAEAQRALANGGDAAAYAPRQVLFTVIALAFFLGVLILVADHRKLTRYAYTCGLTGLVALALPAVLPSRCPRSTAPRCG